MDVLPWVTGGHLAHRLRFSDFAITRCSLASQVLKLKEELHTLPFCSQLLKPIYAFSSSRQQLQLMTAFAASQMPFTPCALLGKWTINISLDDCRLASRCWAWWRTWQGCDSAPTPSASACPTAAPAVRHQPSTSSFPC